MMQSGTTGQGQDPAESGWLRFYYRNRRPTSGRKHLPVPYDAPVSAFEAIAADYPVFRIDTRA